MLKPYTDIKIDCNQNLILSVLDSEGIDVIRFGAIWPWRFNISTNCKVSNLYIISDERISTVAGYDIIYRKLNPDTLLNDLDDYIIYGPVIVNVDQYYIKHHYKHVYLKEHGLHNLIITLKNVEHSYKCIDCIPEYSGDICNDELLKALVEYPVENMRYEVKYLRKNASCSQNEQELYESFMNSILESKKENTSKVHDMDILELSEIINTISDNGNNLDGELPIFLEGTWIWEIDRNAKLTIKYMEKYLSKIVDEETISRAVNEMMYINHQLSLVMKLLFKSRICKSKDILKKALYNLKIAGEHETKLKNKLIGV